MLKKQIVEMVFDEAEEWQEIKEQYERLGYKIIDWIIDYNKKEFYFKSILTEDKKVSFEEAIQAYLKGKDIKCIYNDETTIYNNGFIDSDDDKLIMGQILKGEWYIKED
ncbi:hypothetical protein FDC51_15795 [Clostridium botulinum]|nr:hypothetical protein [Clostridium botulinum]